MSRIPRNLALVVVFTLLFATSICMNAGGVAPDKLEEPSSLRHLKLITGVPFMYRDTVSGDILLRTLTRKMKIGTADVWVINGASERASVVVDKSKNDGVRISGFFVDQAWYGRFKRTVDYRSGKVKDHFSREFPLPMLSRDDFLFEGRSPAALKPLATHKSQDGRTFKDCWEFSTEYHQSTAGMIVREVRVYCDGKGLVSERQSSGRRILRNMELMD